MPYLQLYRDSLCTDLFMSIPAAAITGEPSAAPSTLTYKGRTYKYFDWNNSNLIQHVSVIPQNPPFSTARNRVPAETSMYFKNGVSVKVREATTEGRFEHFIFGQNDLGQSNNRGASASNPAKLFAITFSHEGVNYIGFTGWYEGAQPGYFRAICCVESSFWTDALRPAYDYGGKDDPDGGQGTGHYNHTGVSDSSTPLGIMPTGGRGLHYYKINGDAYSSLQGYLWGDASTIGKSLWQKFINRTHTPISCVIGCFALPDAFAPAGGGSDPIQIAGVRLSPIAGSCMSFDPGISTLEFTFPAQSGADKCFTDYSHTTCKLYVPYCGTIPIPMELALDRVIKVRYRVDQANGNLCACVWAGDCVVGELSGNCAYQIPVIGGDTGALDVLGATLTGLIQISSGDYRGALQSGAEALTAQHTTQIVNGDLSGAVSRCSLRRPYIEYTRNANTYTPGYFRTVGIPARIAGTLSSFAGGYGEFDTQILSADIPGATGDEIAEITSLLREGVFV